MRTKECKSRPKGSRGAQVYHFFRRYPELLKTTFDVLCDERVPDRGGRILRKRSRKGDISLKKSDCQELSRFDCSLVCDPVDDGDDGSVFLCLICRNLLDTPVTGACGHTFCKGCLGKVQNGHCYECDSDIVSFLCTNVLLKEIVRKWIKLNKSESKSECFVTEPKYFLRPRRNKKRYRDGKENAEPSKAVSIWASDFECSLCGQGFLEPVTTGCGHTFCRECLARVLDHGLACPLCKSPLNNYEYRRNETVVVTRAMQLLAKESYQERVLVRQAETIQGKKSNQIPIFVCINAFPSVPCPLYVYEPRYRLLARRTLTLQKKRFGMAAKLSNGDKFASYGTILEIKNCVSMQDGTSILTTMGLRRFKVLSKGEQDGYDTANVQYIRDKQVCKEEVSELIDLHNKVQTNTTRWVSSLSPHLIADIERCIGAMPQTEENWIDSPDGPSWIWWLMPILPLSSQLRVCFLSSTNLKKRLQAIDKILEYMNVKQVENGTPHVQVLESSTSEAYNVTL